MMGLLVRSSVNAMQHKKGTHKINTGETNKIGQVVRIWFQEVVLINRVKDSEFDSFWRVLFGENFVGGVSILC